MITYNTTLLHQEKDSEPAPLPVVVNASDVDPSQPNRKPKGWGEIKLRKVNYYLDQQVCQSSNIDFLDLN